jgi:hypothetical protein
MQTLGSLALIGYILPLQGLGRLQSWKAAEPNVSREGGLDRAELAARIRDPLFRRAQKPSLADEITVRVDRVRFKPR